MDKISNNHILFAIIFILLLIIFKSKSNTCDRFNNDIDKQNKPLESDLRQQFDLFKSQEYNNFLKNQPKKPVYNDIFNPSKPVLNNQVKQSKEKCIIC